MSKAKKEQKTLPGGVTQEQVAVWKKKYKGEVYQVKVTDDSGKAYHCYVTTVQAKRERNLVARAASLVNGDKLVEAAEFVYDNVFLGGDDKLKTDEWLRAQAAQQAMKHFQLPKAESKKM